MAGIAEQCWEASEHRRLPGSLGVRKTLSRMVRRSPWQWVVALVYMSNRPKHGLNYTLRALFGEPPSTWGELRIFLRQWLTPKARRKAGTEGDQRHTLAYYALLSISLVTVGRLVSLGELSTWLSLSALCFAFAIPLLSGTIYTFVSARRAGFNSDLDRGLAYLVDPLGVIASFAGLMLVFVHFSFIAGALFILGTVLAVVTYFQTIRALAKAAVNEQDHDSNNPPHTRP